MKHWLTNMMPNSIRVAFALVGLLTAAPVTAQVVKFPGPAPGSAHAVELSSGTYALSNNLLSISWKTDKQRLLFVGLKNSLNPATCLSGQFDVFRLQTANSLLSTITSPASDGAYLRLHITKTAISAEYGDGQTWHVLKSFVRDNFDGEPSLIRVGKLSLNGDGADNDSPGNVGNCVIDHIIPAMAPALTYQSSQPGTNVNAAVGKVVIDADANTAAYAEYKFIPGTTVISARIMKNTDQGMSWGPGLELVWPNGRFLLVNARTPLGQFDVTTDKGEDYIQQTKEIANYNAPSTTFHLVSNPKFERLASGGEQLTASLKSDTLPITVDWRAILRDNSHYVRQVINVKADADAGMLSGVELVDFPVDGTVQVGDVPGSPIAGNNWFFGFELPVGFDDTDNGARSAIACRLPLTKGLSYTFGSVAGVYPNGQLRRSVLAYVEHERARPTKPFLEYNCWYDYAEYVTDAGFSDSVKQINQQLTLDRGVKLDSYVIDDGWDDHVNSFWGVDPVKFPQGFGPIAAQLKADGSHLGLWISPLGGYSERPMRTANAAKLGLVNGPSLDLSYQPYYNWFTHYLTELMQKYQVNYFKWDKAGDGVNPHFMALLRVAEQIRKVNPNLFINVTVGTWPSPFWLNHIDSTWRGGGDVGWTGDGDKREQWLNYRDEQIYRNVVLPAPLYPLNSLMHHGVVLGNYYQGGDLANAKMFDLRHDVRLYFANGATLQELYLTPKYMTQSAWDDVAASAKWAHANSDVLADSHWIGGDPGDGEVYGYASWSPRKGIFVLRNPSATVRTISIDASKIFELPIEAKRHFVLSAPYPDQSVQTSELDAGKPVVFTLQPFDVLVFEAKPH